MDDTNPNRWTIDESRIAQAKRAGVIARNSHRSGLSANGQGWHSEGSPPAFPEMLARIISRDCPATMGAAVRAYSVGYSEGR